MTAHGIILLTEAEAATGCEDEIIGNLRIHQKSRAAARAALERKPHD